MIMAEPKTKKTFGGCEIDRISPIPTEGLPKVMNMIISFEDALRQHLSLSQALAKLNTHNRSTKDRFISVSTLR